MAIPKGNFIALQPLTPQKESTPNKIPDLVSNMIDGMIKEGKAAEAARLKRLIDEGKRMDDIAKEIKIDPIQTIAPLQEHYSKLYRETADAVADYRMLSNEQKMTPEGMKKYQKMQNMVHGYKQLSTFLANDEERKMFMENLQTQDSEIFQGDPKLSVIKSLQVGAARLTTDENGNFVVQYKDLNDKFTDESRTMPYSEFATSVMKPFEKDTYNSFEDSMRKEAAKMVFTSKDGKGGIRITEKEVFDREKGELSFTSRFGSWDINASSVAPELKHFAYRILPNKEIQSEEDWNTVKKAYVDKLSTYVKESFKVWDTETALDRQQQLASIAATNRSNRGGGSTETNETPNFSSSNQIVFTQVTGRNKNGELKTVLRQEPVRVLTLPKKKGFPSTDNVFGVKRYRNKQGGISDMYYVGTHAEDGRTVMTPVAGQELDSYFVKLGYNPLTAKAYLYSKNPQQANPDVPFIGSQVGKTFNDPRYTKPVFFKIKESKTQEDDL